MSLNYIVHCDNWAQIPHANAGRKTIHGLRNAVLEAKRTLLRNGGDDVCRVYLPKNNWLRRGDEVVAVRRTKRGFAVKYNPKFAAHLRRVA